MRGTISERWYNFSKNVQELLVALMGGLLGIAVVILSAILGVNGWVLAAVGVGATLTAIGVASWMLAHRR